jgi:FtsP/CotA-like multicopper oxidase with cupredoxin domain
MAEDVLEPAERDADLKKAAQGALEAALKAGRTKGYELAYNFFAVNGRKLGEGEPIRVKAGERVLFHVLNASATEMRSLHLPGHRFEVVALDGNPVPRPAAVPVLWLGAAERASAIVEMRRPGVWVMGDVADEDRGRGMGIVVEYAGQKGEPQWRAPERFRWDYRRFARPDARPREPDAVIDLTFATRIGTAQGFDEFTVNGVPFSMERMEPRFPIAHGRRYRLNMRNATDDIHPLHLHRHTFEITSIAGHPTAGVRKDVAMIGAYQAMTVDFTADQKGLSLFHCHMQSHMDFGFMALFDCT